jgi:antagonist of KipI
MSIFIQKEGILMTVQDLGRVGFRRLGINPNGAMDTFAVRIINTLLGNVESEAVLEMHFPAGEIEFESDVVFAIGGADFDATIDGKATANWSNQFGPKGSVLRFTKKNQGNCAYLSVKGGFAVEHWLDSSSTNLMVNLGGFKGRRLLKGDRIAFKAAKPKPHRSMNVGQSLIPKYSNCPTVRVVPSAEYELLTYSGQEKFLNETFAVSKNANRMGYRLEGPTLHSFEHGELLSSAVNFGTIQLLPDGQMIVLMADHQTSGGYPRIGNVIASNLPLLAQLGSGDRLRFEITTQKEAEDALIEFERDLCRFRIGINLAK